MDQAVQAGMSAAEFLAWEEAQPEKWEFDGYQPVAMAGGTLAHADIQVNIILALGRRLRGGSCRPVGSDLKLKADRSYRYPDVMVLCTRGKPKDKIVEDPVVIFEIVSDSTKATDRSTKLAEYQALDSVQRYVIVEQDETLLTVHTRTPDGWAEEVLRDDRTLDMPELGIDVPVAEFYEGVAFGDGAA